MQYPRKLRKGDKIAIVSLSSGMLGEDFCSHNIEIGVKRLKEYGLEPVFMPNTLKGIKYLSEHPEVRARDLKEAFLDDSIAGIICAIGGDDTYRLLPYLMEDEEFISAVKRNPKLFTGFSDTTINHLMFYKLGLSTCYGPTFICDLGEISDEMLPYSKKAFESYLEGYDSGVIESSQLWYEERKDFSKAAIGTERVAHKEERGFELLQGKEYFKGRLLGGCLEGIYDIFSTHRHEDKKDMCEKYSLFPSKEEWTDKILFIETCEEKPSPELFEKEIKALKDYGVFDVVSGVLVGKPQDEAYYDEYKEILIRIVDNDRLPIVYNVNFGHATPRCALQYGVMAVVDMRQKKIFMGNALEIFKNWNETLIWSCLQGVMGEIHTNTENDAAMAILGDFAFYAGNPSEDMVRFKPEGFKQDFIIMVPQNDEWGKLIEKCYGDKARKVTRYAIKKEPEKDIFDVAKLEQAVSSLPDGYEIKMIEEAEYNMCRENGWANDLVSQFKDYQSYKKLGLGAVILKDGELVAGASSYGVYNEGIEIEIDTRGDHRRKGLAYACGAKLILECLQRGLYPSWDAQNKWSVALAEKLGYHFSHEYTAYEIIGY